MGKEATFIKEMLLRETK